MIIQRKPIVLHTLLPFDMIGYDCITPGWLVQLSADWLVRAGWMSMDEWVWMTRPLDETGWMVAASRPEKN